MAHFQKNKYINKNSNHQIRLHYVHIVITSSIRQRNLGSDLIIFVILERWARKYRTVEQLKHVVALEITWKPYCGLTQAFWMKLDRQLFATSWYLNKNKSTCNLYQEYEHTSIIETVDCARLYGISQKILVISAQNGSNTNKIYLCRCSININVSEQKLTNDTARGLRPL